MYNLNVKTPIKIAEYCEYNFIFQKYELFFKYSHFIF